MPDTMRVVFEPVKVENILRVMEAEYVGETESEFVLRLANSLTSKLGERTVPKGQKVRIIFELCDEDKQEPAK
jgi:hypothetical protein